MFAGPFFLLFSFATGQGLGVLGEVRVSGHGLQDAASRRGSIMDGFKVLWRIVAREIDLEETYHVHNGWETRTVRYIRRQTMLSLMQQHDSSSKLTITRGERLCESESERRKRSKMVGNKLSSACHSAQDREISI